MATYFPTSNNQRDAATMPYSRDCLPSSYSETQIFPGNDTTYMDFSSSSISNPRTSEQEVMLNIGGSRITERDFNTDDRNEMLMMNSGQGLLSLSLSPLLGPNPSISSEERRGIDYFEENDYSGAMKLSSDSKYLQAVQELLDEVVNVKKAIDEGKLKKALMKDSKGELGNGVSDKSTLSSEVSASEKLDWQNKMAKLLSMLDEVDRRYKHYSHQMQTVVSSFDVLAGSGAATPYTALALQTISRHFRCLRDAINGQIQTVRKILGEQDNFSNIGISRLRYVDKQLGMMQQNLWRPQRGLPENSVSILRAWLFEHFLHPYPKDSDKIMLARQTGLTRSQVSNWFINARVRLWKPMVEEMYIEENGDAQMDSNSSSETTPKVEDLHQAATLNMKNFDSISDQMVGSDNNSAFHDSRKTKQDEGQLNYGSVEYQISEMERFGNENGVSLTLGLQQCEGGNMVISDDTHDGFVYNATDLAVETEITEFEWTDSENRQHEFVSSRF